MESLARKWGEVGLDSSSDFLTIECDTFRPLALSVPSVRIMCERWYVCINRPCADEQAVYKDRKWRRKKERVAVDGRGGVATDGT